MSAVPDPAAIEEALRILAGDLAESVCRTYRLEREEAAARILAAWEKDAQLRAAIAGSADLGKIKRMRAYKDAASAARKSIYFGLRRYHSGGAALADATAELEVLACGAPAGAVLQRIAAAHASTAERLDHIDDFWNEILRAIGDARTVLDVGAGVLPCLFPFTRAPNVATYLACDRDAAAMRAVAAFARQCGDERVRAVHWDLTKGWAPVQAAAGVACFDIALMLKIVPVLRRQEPEMLKVLAHVPARRVIVTGSKEALVKRRAIARRESGVIESFVREAGFHTLHGFETGDEIGIVAETGR